MGIGIFLLTKAGRKCPKAAPTGAAIKPLHTGGCTGLPRADTPSASRGPSTGTRGSMGARSSAQLSPAELLACAAPCAVEPKTGLRLACS